MTGRSEREDDGRVDVEAAFADIVARWDAPPAPRGPWPAEEDCSDPGDDAPDGGTTADPTGGSTGEPPARRAGGPAGAPPDDPPGPVPGGRLRPGPAPAEPGAADAGLLPPAPAWGPARSHVGGERVIRAAREEDDRDRARASGDDGDGGAEGYQPPEPPPLPRGDLVSRLAWAGVLGSPLFFLVCALAWRDVPRVLVVAAILAFVGGFVTLVVRLPSSRDDGWDDGAVV